MLVWLSTVITKKRLGWLRTLARIARRIQADLLFSGTVRAAFYCALAVRFMQAPFVWNAQDFWLSETRPRVTALDRLGKKFLCRSASLIIANSKATCEHLPRSDKLRVVHNGILIERYEPSTAAAQDFRRRYQIPGQSPLVRMAALEGPPELSYDGLSSAGLHSGPDAGFACRNGSQRPHTSAAQPPANLTGLGCGSDPGFKWIGGSGYIVLLPHLSVLYHKY